MKLENVILPGKPSTERFDIQYEKGKIQSITPCDTENPRTSPPSRSSLILPALCHPHIHLDKAYLLTSNSSHHHHHRNRQNASSDENQEENQYPDYADLALQSGTFDEALQNTSRAKTRYTTPDLVLRGSQLIAESITYGVTSMRAFVEIDHVTQYKTLDAAIQLKHKFARTCYVQICVFAQDPIFSGEHGDENRRLIEAVLGNEEYKDVVEVLGTTPYVEDDYSISIENVKWAIDRAARYGLHLDFHLDYNLDEDQRAVVLDVVDLLIEAESDDGSTTSKSEEETRRSGTKQKTIALGHCTRMTLFKDEQMQELASKINEHRLPVSFVGLPTSDLFMMGRPSNSKEEDESQCSGDRSRGTLQILDMIRKHGLHACMGVNNVGNAFTPWGSADPLKLACLGVGLYHAGTIEDAELLYECVSVRARKAIGLESGPLLKEFEVVEGTSCPETGGLLVIGNDGVLDVSGGSDNDVNDERGIQVPARQRLSVKDVVWDPPESRLRRLL